MVSARPATFLFDLDGTLVDSVYEHVLAWREALEQVGIELSVWRIHRRIGMSGGLLINALLRETGTEITAKLVEEVQRRHAEAYVRRSAQVRPLPGAKELLKYLTESKVPWAVATSGRITRLWKASISARWPGSTTVVESTWVTIAGPSMVSPGRSRSRWWTVASTQSPR